MALDTIITIVIVAFVLLFAWALLKKVFKLMFYLGIIVIFLLLLNILFLYQDVSDLRQNFTLQTKKVILVDGEEIITGFFLDPNVNVLEPEQLNQLTPYIRDKDYETILDDSYKLMIFDVGIISEIDNEIEFENELITPNKAIGILKSNTENEIKASLFSIILADEILNSRNPLFFFSEYKKGNIVVYPETTLFKTVKIIPVSFIKDIGEKILYKTKEKVKTIVVEE